MAAREARHRFLAGAARAEGAENIALAHHADDQVELFFLRLLRGAGMRGLAGMRWSSPSPADARVQLVRPLLECSKAGLIEFARAARVKFREDASNGGLDILRNKVRLELLPLLTRSYQPGLAGVILREMEILGAEGGFMERLAEEWRRKPTGPFAELDVALQRRVLQSALIELGLKPDFEAIERLREAAGRVVTLESDVRLTREDSGRVRRVSTATEVERNTEPLVVELDGRARDGTFDGLDWSWKLSPAQKTVPKFGAGCEWFDAGRIGEVITLRHWLPGDRFQPAGMARPVKLQDLFTNAKIPRPTRTRLVVGVTAEGEIWWVEGLRVAEKFKLQPGTRRRLRWSWRRVAGMK
jgi:tRNA(Ile)-lysidine synthase